MYVVLGATGHVGSAVADTLLADGQAVTVVTRDGAKAADWRAKGAEAAVLDVTNVDALRAVFRRGQRAFLLNPRADPSTDTEIEEHRTFEAIVRALDGSGLRHLVVESTYGAQPGDRCGDLDVLYDFEQALAAQPIPTAVLRAAYYFSNWDAQLDAAREGALPTMLPPDLALPMVAPDDLGRAAARLLQSSDSAGRIHYVEGPERYTANDVAAAFARALDRPVAAKAIPQDQWIAIYHTLGFSEAAARSYARMTEVTATQPFEPQSPIRGATTLQAYIDALVQRSATA